MIQDNSLLLSNAQAVTASAASSNVVDMGGAGEQGFDNLQLCITCNQSAASGGGAATVQIALQNCATVGGSYTTVVETAPLAQAVLTAGMAPLYIAIPPGTSLEFLQAYFTVASGPLTAGEFSVSVVYGADVKFYGAVRDQS